MQVQIMRKSEKAITLIALVVTIIVLLILAGVTIVTLTGENGLLNQAQNSKTRNEEAKAKEGVDLILAEWRLAKESDKNLTFDNFLQEKKENGEIEDYINESGSYYVEKDGYRILALKDDALLSALGKNKSEHYGDFINYGIDISSTDSNHIDGWKIFYANEEGTFIIAADCVRSDNEALAAAMASDKANIRKYPGNNYSVYWPNANYLTKKDTNGNAIIDSNASKFMYNWTGGGMTQDNKIAVASLLDTNAWSSFLTDGATMAIGGPTIEMLRASWNEKTYTSGTHTKLQIAQETINGYGYYVGANNDENASVTKSYVDMSTDVGYNDTLYYPHKAIYNNCQGCWLASPSVFDINGVEGLYFSGIVGGSWCSVEGPGIRPVVFLPASVKAEQDEHGVWQIIK